MIVYYMYIASYIHVCTCTCIYDVCCAHTHTHTHIIKDRPHQLYNVHTRDLVHTCTCIYDVCCAHTHTHTHIIKDRPHQLYNVHTRDLVHTCTIQNVHVVTMCYHVHIQYMCILAVRWHVSTYVVKQISCSKTGARNTHTMLSTNKSTCKRTCTHTHTHTHTHKDMHENTVSWENYQRVEDSYIVLQDER